MAYMAIFGWEAHGTFIMHWIESPPVYPKRMKIEKKMVDQCSIELSGHLGVLKTGYVERVL